MKRAESFRSVDHMTIPYLVMPTLATMTIDGVSERFSHLKCGVIEQGATWVPGWMRLRDSAHDAFRKSARGAHAAPLAAPERV